MFVNAFKSTYSFNYDYQYFEFSFWNVRLQIRMRAGQTEPFKNHLSGGKRIRAPGLIDRVPEALHQSIPKLAI